MVRNVHITLIKTIMTVIIYFIHAYKSSDLIYYKPHFLFSEEFFCFMVYTITCMLIYNTSFLLVKCYKYLFSNFIMMRVTDDKQKKKKTKYHISVSISITKYILNNKIKCKDVVQSYNKDLLLRTY